jgi:hypothetical protein
MALIKTTFKELFNAGRLPSGHEFELMPDTVETMLRVAEANDAFPWKEKASQALAVTARVGSSDVQKEGVEFIHSMLDMDVLFLAMAWTSQLHGFEIKLGRDGIPCPACNAAIKAVPFGDTPMHVRPEPVSGPAGVNKVTNVPDGMPASLKSCTLYFTDPTWQAARQHIAERVWSSPEVVGPYRVIAALRASSTDGSGVRPISVQAEGRQIKARAMAELVQQLDEFVPHFDPTLLLVCPSCKTASEIPFDTGV